jgi:ATP-dependent protease HslVU (ClpYQ) peptidase subunit
MTAIVGIQGKGWAVIAADSMTTYDDKPYFSKSFEKVTRKGDYVFAFAGDAIAGNIANFIWTPPKFIKTVSTDVFIQTKVLPSLRDVLKDNGYEPDTTKNPDAGFDALICINGIIYEIDQDFLWSRDDRGLYAVGSGGSIALGALATGFSKNSMKAAEFAARRAIKISADYTISVGGDVKVITQKGNEMAAMKKITKKAAYAAYEKTEPKATKKMELKKGESKAQVKKEVAKGMAMMKKKAK